MDQLAAWIGEELGRQLLYRAYVDTGPHLERELAQRAGLGWIGKNCNLIHPRLGSYLFLGELLTDLELELDDPFSDERCGSCTACLDGCPTGALTAPHTLDARRCISYLTIEHRGAVPEAMRALVGDWVFGCDVCQEVCPWNRRFARPTPEPAFRAAHSTLDLLEMLALDEGAFRSRFRDTALWRAKRTGLARNAAVVLGNLGDATVTPALEHALNGLDPLVAEPVVWALGRLGRPPGP
jgi:epoxyqueuosine reductase